MGNICSSDQPKPLSADGKAESMVKYEDPEVEDDDTDVMAPGQEPSFVVAKPKRRAGVSAGSVDQTNYTKKVVDKSDTDRAIIEGRLKESFLFESLDKDALKDVVDGVEIKNFAPGDVLMKQGDDGDYFYIVEEGEAQIFVKTEQEPEKMVKEVGSGGSFGELALMYDAPRNATIKAKTELKCWSVSRDTFKMTLVAASNAKRDRHKKFIDDVPILAELEPKEKLVIADALQKDEVKQGTKIITEGEEGNMFYIIENGTVSFNKGDEEVGTATVGGYFGEIALLTSEKRQVSVTCTTDCVLLSLDRATFVRVMGPLQKILKRNMETYKNYQMKI